MPDTIRPAGDPAPENEPAGKEQKKAPGTPSRRPSRASLAWRDLPWEAIAVGLGLFAVLAVFVAADPAGGVTASNSPWTDEGFFTVNARNLIQFGHWSTDEWNLYLVNLPLSVLQAIWFAISGVGIVQARLINIACVSLTAFAIVMALRGVTGRATAIFGGLAFAASGLILYYGRLVYLEDLVVLAVTVGTLVLVRDERLTLRWGGFSGLCYGIAIATKASAAVPVAGIVAAMIVAVAWRDAGARRWIAGVIAASAAFGLAWLAVVWLPNRDAVAMDLKIWAQVRLSLAPIDALRTMLRYFATDNDHVFGVLLGPLLLLGAAGLGAVFLARRRLSRAQARTAFIAIGWLVFGCGVLLIASYRPNRYVVPLVPPLAILSAMGLDLALQWLRERPVRGSDETELSAVRAGGRGPRRFDGWAGPLLLLAATAVAVAPGISWYASWAHGATYTMENAETRLASAVPDGQMVAGTESAVFLMKSHAITLLTQPVGGVANNGDLYAAGVRYYMLPAGGPAPRGVSGSIWAARHQIFCAEYGGVTQCLFHLP